MFICKIFHYFSFFLKAEKTCYWVYELKNCESVYVGLQTCSLLFSVYLPKLFQTINFVGKTISSAVLLAI